MIVVERIISEDLHLGALDVDVTHAGGGTLQGTQISLTTFSRAGPNGFQTQLSFDMAEIAPLGYFTDLLTVPNAMKGDFVLVTFRPNPTDPPHLGMSPPEVLIQGYVVDTNSVVIYAFNPTTATLPARNITLAILVFGAR
jgi:hypothetical protein